jgi:integrase
MTMLALETAMRMGELLALQWEHVHLEQRWIRLVDSKNGEGRNVPLSAKAVELLTVLKGEKDRGPVFTVSPGVASTLFRKACRAAGVSGIRFHDLRHEATTRLSKKLSVLELAAVTGHRDLRSLQIYFNPHAWELAEKL